MKRYRTVMQVSVVDINNNDKKGVIYGCQKDYGIAAAQDQDEGLYKNNPLSFFSSRPHLFLLSLNFPNYPVHSFLSCSSSITFAPSSYLSSF